MGPPQLLEPCYDPVDPGRGPSVCNVTGLLHWNCCCGYCDRDQPERLGSAVHGQIELLTRWAGPDESVDFEVIIHIVTSSKYHLSVTLVTKCVWAACPSGPGPHNTGKPELRQECSQCLTMNSLCLESSRPAFFAALHGKCPSRKV